MTVIELLFTDFSWFGGHFPVFCYLSVRGVLFDASPRCLPSREPTLPLFAKNRRALRKRESTITGNWRGSFRFCSASAVQCRCHCGADTVSIWPCAPQTRLVQFLAGAKTSPAPGRYCLISRWPGRLARARARLHDGALHDGRGERHGKW